MTELQILNAVKNNGGAIVYTELINLGQTDSTWEPAADKRLIEKLIESNVLSGKTEAYSYITFGKEGRLRLRDLQKVADDLAKDMANQKSEKKINRRFQFMNTLIGIILGAAGTLAVELIIQKFF